MKKERIKDGFYVITNKAFLQNEDISDATVAYNNHHEPYVAVSFTPSGTKVFSKITEDNIGNRLAIVVDRQIQSAPVIRSKINGGKASIDFGSAGLQQAVKEAQKLAQGLRKR